MNLCDFNKVFSVQVTEIKPIKRQNNSVEFPDSGVVVSSQTLEGIGVVLVI